MAYHNNDNNHIWWYYDIFCHIFIEVYHYFILIDFK